MNRDPRYPPTAHYRLLAEMINANGWTIGAELGVLKGKCFLYLMEHCPRLTLIGVDQWQHLPPSDEDGAETYRAHDMRRSEAFVRDGAKRFKGRAIIIKADTVEAAAEIEDESLDFAFIDACHTEASTAANIVAWAPKVRMTGCILGHDWNWSAVRRALDRVVPGWTGHAEHVWSIEKVRYLKRSVAA